MNETQRQSLLRAIAISSGTAGFTTPQQRSDAFTNLEQFKAFPGRVASCVEMIGCSSLQISEGGNAATLDVTVPGKLYALGVIQKFLKVGYTGLNESDRVQLRLSIVLAARQLAMPITESYTNINDSTRILATKIAVLLADLALRDFPQRWTTFVADLFGGIWCEAGSENEGNAIGIKICLECLKLVIEDCTDSDYNARVSVTLSYQ